MLTRFTPFDRTFAMMEEWRRRMDRAFSDFDSPFLPVGTFEDPWSLSEATWPQVNMYDTGTNLLFVAEVPGMSDKDLQIQIQNDVLTLSGERKVQVPAGYAPQRRERAPISFTRTFALPAKVDADKVNASLKNGLLHIEMPKVPEAQPRQINVRASS